MRFLGVNVTGNVVHRDCANQTTFSSGCISKTQGNWSDLPWYQSFSLLHPLVSAGEFTGEVCLSDVQGGNKAPITETLGPLMIAFCICVAHYLIFQRLVASFLQNSVRFVILAAFFNLARCLQIGCFKREIFSNEIFCCSFVYKIIKINVLHKYLEIGQIIIR